jgi:hypothetical protein
MVTVGVLAAIGMVGFVGLLSVGVTAVRKRALQRQRVEQQLELIHALPVADYRLRAVVG